MTLLPPFAGTAGNAPGTGVVAGGGSAIATFVSGAAAGVEEDATAVGATAAFASAVDAGVGGAPVGALAGAVSAETAGRVPGALDTSCAVRIGAGFGAGGAPK
ncbi:MAG: hypothetical protein ABSA49_13300 [Rhizomicrobium sp.]